MTTGLKRQIAFALTMGVFTTGIVSLVLLALNRGFADGFAFAWLRSWAVSYVIVIPMILQIGPRIQVLIERLIPMSTRE